MEDLTLIEARLIEMGFIKRNDYLWYEWFPFGLKLIEDDFYLDDTPMLPYWALRVGGIYIDTKVKTENHLLEIFKAHRVPIKL